MFAGPDHVQVLRVADLWGVVTWRAVWPARFWRTCQAAPALGRGRPHVSDSSMVSSAYPSYCSCSIRVKLETFAKRFKPFT
jgi:hypothetical protein